MAVVKADGYGHGLLPVARAALAGGATWLGTAIIDEALLLRAAGIEVPLLAWLWSPSETVAVAEAIRADIDLSVSSTWALDVVVAAARDAGRRASVHLKIDTGLSRNGAYVDDWPDLVAAAAKAETGGEIAAVGVWSHFAYADDPGHPTVARQLDRFREGVAAGRAERSPPAGAPSRELGRDPHQSGGALRSGATRHRDLRLVSGADRTETSIWFRPCRFGPRRRWSSGYIAARASRTVTSTTRPQRQPRARPLGYADGIPRQRDNRAPVQVAGARFRISGRVCMDQFVVDVGEQAVAAGDPVVLFGSGRDGEPTAQDWADAAETIHYEIVTRVGPRVPRRYVGAAG